MTLHPLVFASALVVAATAARAQDAPTKETPSERRVATNPAAALTSGAWTFTLTTFDGYDWVEHQGLDSALSGADERVLLSGQRAGASAEITSRKGSGDSTFTLSGKSTASQYAIGDKLLASADVAASESTRVGRHTFVSAAGTFSYAPYYSLNVFPTLNTFTGTDLSTPHEPSLDFAIDAQRMLRYGGSGQITHALTDRTDVSGNYSLSMTDIDGLSTNAMRQDAGVRVTHRLSQALGVRFGYGAMAASFEPASRPELFHSVDVGFDARKAWSRTRRTTFSVSTGSTIRQRGEPASSAVKSLSVFQVTGNAVLTHYTGRTWSTRVAYDRDWQLLDGSTAPSFTDSISVGTSGTFGNRVAGGVNAASMLSRLPDRSHDSRGYAHAGTGWLVVAVNARLALFSQYSYYRQRFQNRLPAQNLLSDVDRNSVRAGLMLLLPPGKLAR